MDEITTTIHNFSEKFIKLHPVWLRDCVDYFKQQENTAPNYTQENLEKFIFAQWILFDIREVDLPILPKNITEEKKYELKNTITLQLLSVVDISRPKYSQIQKIRYKLEKPLESDVKDCAFKGDSKRCLQLTLTDGVTEIQAFEYKPISNIKLNLTPGMKIRFNAPLMVRYGQIMLESENNIELLGGEVEELLISNAPENILAAALNLPLNNNPSYLGQNIELPNAFENPRINPKNTVGNFFTKTNLPVKDAKIVVKQNVLQKTDDDDDEFDMLMEIERELHGDRNVMILTNTVQNKSKEEKPKSSLNIFDEETFDQHVDYMLDLEDELKKEHSLMNIKSNILKTPDQNVLLQNKYSKSKTVFDSDSDKSINLPKKRNSQFGLPENAKSPMDGSVGITADSKTNLHKEVKKSDTTKTITDIMKKYQPFKSSSDIIEVLSSPDGSPKKKAKLIKNPLAGTSREIFKDPANSPIVPTKANQNKSEQISPVKCIALSKLSKTPITTGKFKVRAKFKKVVEKLTIKDDKWHAKLQIEDPSGTLEVSIDDELVNKLMECTYQELQIFAKSEGEKFKNALDTFKSKLQSLDGLMEISFINKIPRIINII